MESSTSPLPAPSPPGATTLVVGAGITGLTAAYTRAASGHRVVVVDAAARAGGKIRTEPFAGHDLDTAADAFLARVPEAIDLCRELGLADRLVTPASRRAYLLRDGQLHPFPDGLVLGVPTDFDALRRSGLLSPEAVDQVEADLTLGGEPPDGDTTVGQLVRSRLGDEAFELFVEPLLSGVNAGDADQLSVQAGAPQFAAAVRDQPSLVAGLRAQKAAATAAADAPVFYGLRGGTGVLVDALVAAIVGLGGELRLGTAADCVVATDGTGPTSPGVAGTSTGSGRWTLTLDDGGSIVADHVILAVPPPVAATIVRDLGLAPTVTDEMAALDYASVAMVALAFPRDAVADPLDGTGFLVSRREGLLATACSWASSKWAHLDDGDQVLLRASAGRSGDRRALELEDAELAARVTEELRPILGLTGAPTAVRVTRWDRALPQFRPGHLDRVAAWRSTLAAEAPGLVLAGAGYDGLGIPACIRQGRAAARTVTD